uniref:Uncharacterized protein n=1 Tax=Heterorhabditis bacteriophora TaxID=37862 RepID=A0A1I7W6G8_HETBA
MVASRNVFTVTRHEVPPPQDHFTFLNRTRFIILLICTLCLSIAQSNTLTLNFTIICMAGDAPNIDTYNTTGKISSFDNGSYYEVGNSGYLDKYFHAVESRHYAYTSNQKNLLFSFVAIGAMIAVYPVMWLIQVSFRLYNYAYFFTFYHLFKNTHFNIDWTNFHYARIRSLVYIVIRVAFRLLSSCHYHLHFIWPVFIFLQKHSFVSLKELDRINRGKGDTSKKEPVPVKVMGFPIEQTGLFSAIPQV